MNTQLLTGGNPQYFKCGSQTDDSTIQEEGRGGSEADTHALGMHMHMWM